MYFEGYYFNRHFREIWDMTKQTPPKEYGEYLAGKKRKKKKKRTKHK